MTTSLPADPETARLAEKLASETGKPVESVVRDAIEAHAVRQMKLDALRATIEASIAEGGSYTLEEVLRSVDEHLALLNQTPADS